MEKTLQDMAAGEKGRVAGYVKADKVYREKLLSMGLTRGTEFTVQRIAPMGDPVEIQVRGFSLSVRKSEASALIIEKTIRIGDEIS